MGDHFRAQDNYVQIVELTPALRQRIEQTIEHLVSLLDVCDGDPDLEASLAGYQRAMTSYGAAACDLEFDDADDETGGDDEPSLGWLHFSDGRPRLEWNDDGSDREEENEHNEDGADDEPSLGWTLNGVAGQTFDTDEMEPVDYT